MSLLGRVLGQAHPETIMDLAEMGLVMRDEGRLEDAENAIRRALAPGREKIGTGHPCTLQVTVELERVVERRGRLNEAEASYPEAREVCTPELGSEHRQTLTAMVALGRRHGAAAPPDPRWRPAWCLSIP